MNAVFQAVRAALHSTAWLSIMAAQVDALGTGFEVRFDQASALEVSHEGR